MILLRLLNDLQEDSQLAKITRDSAKITVEQVHGLMSQVICTATPLFCCVAISATMLNIYVQFISRPISEKSLPHSYAV